MAAVPTELPADLRDTRASLLLDLIRIGASQAVCLGHAISFFQVIPALQPPRFPYLQNVAVQLFFVLSGFLIAYTLASRSTRPGYGFAEYFIERFARIYSAYLPALLLIVAVDLVVWSAGRYEFPQYLTLRAFVGNVLMLQNWPGPFSGLLTVPSLGSAGPLWTLAIEWHIYLFVGALFFLGRTRRPLLLGLLALSFGIVPLRYLFGELQPGVGTALFSLWLFGFAGYFVFAQGYFRGMKGSVIALIALTGFAGYVRYLAPGAEYQPRAYVFLSVLFLALIALAARYRRGARSGAERLVRWVAGYSFTLFLIHYSVLYAFSRLWDGSPMSGMLAGVVSANVMALLLALPTEMRHGALAGLLKRRLLQGRTS
jgi:peptidoglycan/LPS O-acetylase OafA/YrhL